jgi:hypothetical protein
MAITGAQLIYRLQNTVRLLMDYRQNPTPDSYNLYWSSTELGVYVKFASFLNEPSRTPSIRGKIQFEFIPSTIVGWDNSKDNWLKIKPVTAGVEGAFEGPMKVPTREELINYAEKTISYGFNKDSQKFIPLAVDVDGKLITA